MQPLDQNECLVPHLKDLFHICLESEAQGNNMTFSVCNLGSKQPHLYSGYVVSVPSQLHTTVAQNQKVSYSLREKGGKRREKLLERFCMLSLTAVAR